MKLPYRFHEWPEEERINYFRVSRTRQEIVKELGEMANAEAPDESHAYLRKEYLAAIAAKMTQK